MMIQSLFLMICSLAAVTSTRVTHRFLPSGPVGNENCQTVHKKSNTSDYYVSIFKPCKITFYGIANSTRRRTQLETFNLTNVTEGVLEETLKGANVTEENVQETLKGLNVSKGDIEETLKELNDSLKGLNETLKDLDLKDYLKDLNDNIKSLEESLKDLHLKEVLTELNEFFKEMNDENLCNSTLNATFQYLNDDFFQNLKLNETLDDLSDILDAFSNNTFKDLDFEKIVNDLDDTLKDLDNNSKDLNLNETLKGLDDFAKFLNETAMSDLNLNETLKELNVNEIMNNLNETLSHLNLNDTLKKLDEILEKEYDENLQNVDVDKIMEDIEGQSCAAWTDDLEVIKVTERKVFMLPDSCVSQMDICYDIVHDEIALSSRILFFNTTYEIEIPEGATIVSVNCEADHEALVEFANGFSSLTGLIGWVKNLLIAFLIFIFCLLIGLIMMFCGGVGRLCHCLCSCFGRSKPKQTQYAPIPTAPLAEEPSAPTIPVKFV